MRELGRKGTYDIHVAHQTTIMQSVEPEGQGSGDGGR